MTRASIDRLIAVFQQHQHDGLDVAIPAVLRAAAEIRDELLPVTPTTRLAAKGVIEAVAYRHGLGVAEVLSTSRYPDVNRCRWECMAELRAMRFSTPAIGKFLRRDHSSVVYGLRRFAEEFPDHVPVADELAPRREARAA